MSTEATVSRSLSCMVLLFLSFILHEEREVTGESGSVAVSLEKSMFWRSWKTTTWAIW